METILSMSRICGSEVIKGVTYVIVRGTIDEGAGFTAATVYDIDEHANEIFLRVQLSDLDDAECCGGCGKYSLDVHETDSFGALCDECVEAPTLRLAVGF